MKVKELITYLETFNPEHPVVWYDEGWWVTPSDIDLRRAAYIRGYPDTPVVDLGGRGIRSEELAAEVGYQLLSDQFIEKHKDALKALAEGDKHREYTDDGRTYSEAEPDEP